MVFFLVFFYDNPKMTTIDECEKIIKNRILSKECGGKAPPYDFSFYLYLVVISILNEVQNIWLR